MAERMNENTKRASLSMRYASRYSIPPRTAAVLMTGSSVSMVSLRRMRGCFVPN
jgi:hypothetical protein